MDVEGVEEGGSTHSPVGEPVLSVMGGGEVRARSDGLTVRQEVLDPEADGFGES